MCIYLNFAMCLWSYCVIFRKTNTNSDNYQESQRKSISKQINLYKLIDTGFNFRLGSATIILIPEFVLFNLKQ